MIVAVLDPIPGEERQKALVDGVRAVLTQVRVAVRDWPTMVAKLDESIAALKSHPPSNAGPELAESIAFLDHWQDTFGSESWAKMVQWGAKEEPAVWQYYVRNGSADAVHDSKDRARVAAVGWAKWAPVSAVAIGMHLIGGGGGLYANRHRAKNQSGVTGNTVAKILLTGAALGATAYSGVLGAKTAQGDGHAAAGATEPSASTPDDVAAAQHQLRYLQWALPVLTGSIVVLGAQQGEQQRPGQVLTGVANTLARRARN